MPACLPPAIFPSEDKKTEAVSKPIFLHFPPQFSVPANRAAKKQTNKKEPPSHQNKAFQGLRVSWVWWTPGSQDSKHSTDINNSSLHYSYFMYAAYFILTVCWAGDDAFILQGRKLA